MVRTLKSLIIQYIVKNFLYFKKNIKSLPQELRYLINLKYFRIERENSEYFEDNYYPHFDFMDYFWFCYHGWLKDDWVSMNYEQWKYHMDCKNLFKQISVDNKEFYIYASQTINGSKPILVLETKTPEHDTLTNLLFPVKFEHDTLINLSFPVKPKHDTEILCEDRSLDGLQIYGDIFRLMKNPYI